MGFKKYPKINSIWKRDMESKKKEFMDEYSDPYFEYLRNVEWIGTEKIDGTNIRIFIDDECSKIGGRTDKAVLPIGIIKWYQSNAKRFTLVDGLFKECNVILYGEGYGEKIQGCGADYLKGENSFILFDVALVSSEGNFVRWLRREEVEVIACIYDLKIVPIISRGSLKELEDLTIKGFQSKITDEKLIAEGLVCTPLLQLYSKYVERIIVKMKHKDYLL